jgi:hypothetical protein
MLRRYIIHLQIFILALITILIPIRNAYPYPSGETLLSPEDFQAFDRPSDSGGEIALSWKAALYDRQGVSYAIYWAEGQAGPYRLLARIAPNTHYKRDLPGPWWSWKASTDYHFYSVKSGQDITLVNGQPYFFKLTAMRGDQTAESPVKLAIPAGNFFNWNKLNNLFLTLLFTALITISINRAKKNPKIFLRRIAGLDAIEEAIGRATEMGKPILYLTGLDDMSSVSTIAATIILAEVAKRTADYETALKVPHRDPIVMAVCQEIVKEAYLEMGRPDSYQEDSNFFITTDQFSYTAAVDGIMLRERPAANFYMGHFYAESLLLAETGICSQRLPFPGSNFNRNP